MASAGVNTGKNVKMTENGEIKKGPVGEIEFQVSQVIGRLEEAVIGKTYSSPETSVETENELPTAEESPDVQPKPVLHQLEDLLLHDSENEVEYTALPELCDASRLSVVSHAIAAYSGSLERNHIAHLSSKISNTVDLLVTDLFRCENYKVCYHDDQLGGIVRVVRALLNTKIPHFSELGYEAIKKLPIIYTSVTSPIGIVQFICTQLGLPLRCLNAIPCNTLFGSQKMDLAALEREIETDKENNKLPLIVLADAGTPVSGHVDNLTRLQEICKSNSVWLHLRGHSLAALPIPQYPNSTGHIADSMTLPLGIWLGIPGLPTATVYNHELLVPAAAGLLDTPGRKLISLPLWTTFQCLGKEEIRKRFQRAFECCQHLWQKLVKFPNIRILSQSPGGEGGIISVSELATKPVNANILFEVAASTVVFQFIPENHQGRVPVYYDKLNSWLGQILQRDCSLVNITLCEIENSEVVLRYCPLEPQPGLHQAPDFDMFVSCLEQQIEILSATVRHKSEFQRLVAGSECLRPVEIEGWAGLGGVRYQPLAYRELQLTDQVKQQLNSLNISLVERLRATDAAFSLGEGGDGLACVRFGMVTSDTDVGELLSLVESAGQEEEETGKVLDTMAEVVKRGIEAATLELQRESDEQLWQEGLLRAVPVVGSLVNWWSPHHKGSGIKGRSLDLTAGVVASTENIYRFRKPKVKDGPKQSLDVYCRLRPTSSPGPVCIKVISSTTVHMIPASNSVQLRNGPPPKEMQYSFKKVFDENVSQKDVFETVAFPLVENVLMGNNGLLFTYGVTGSGKTFTMTGSKADGGIMPRCIDTIFNSIGLSNAGKYIFKADKLNGFEIQSEADALMERQQDLLLQLTPAKNKLPRLERINTETEFLNRVVCDNKANIIEDNIYSVFVTFVEIYNNSVYDLLDEASSEGFRPTPIKGPPQVKIIREDSDHNMFVHGVNEVEVKSADEAFQVFGLGQKRRKIAHTALNAESSRAHTIFTIRVVQAPMDDFGQVVVDKKCISVGQLSLVDLAGSERTKRTENTGQRLREAGNINNSLMTLRSCLEILRENQKGANKMVPYRDSRLTHLFKSFFEGEGSVAMVVCANPRAEDYDENMHVLKFAEVSQEIQIFCPPTPKLNYASTPSRRRKFKLQRCQGLDKENKDSLPTTIRVSTASEFFADIPAVGYLGLEDDDDLLKRSIDYLESHMLQFESFGINLNQRGFSIRESFVNLDYEVQKMKALYDREKGKATDLESKVRNTDLQVSSYKRKIDEYDMNIKRLKRELSEKELLINKTKVDSSKVREQYNSKIAATEEKLKDEMERRLRSQKSALEFELRSKERKLREAKRVLSDESLRRVPSTPEPERFRPPALCTPLSMRPPSPNFRSTGRRLPATRRPRRSRSAESWLEHKPPAPTALPTVLQPVMTRRRSVSKLADAKDVLSSGADRYCLVTQGQDSDGDLEARIYKGDIVPTTSGGAQVTFSDVEILRQKSPTSPTRRLPSDPKGNNEKLSTIPVKANRFRR